jgi:hypothetical protein
MICLAIRVRWLTLDSRQIAYFNGSLLERNFLLEDLITFPRTTLGRGRQCSGTWSVSGGHLKLWHPLKVPLPGQSGASPARF